MATRSDKLVQKLDAAIRTLQDVADLLRETQDVVSAQLAARIDAYRSKRLCLTCSTEIKPDDAVRRGCHQACYNTTMQRIARGEITRAKALEMGLFNPIAVKPGRKSGRPDPLRPDPLRIQEEPDAATLNAVSTARSQITRERRRDKRKGKSP